MIGSRKTRGVGLRAGLGLSSPSFFDVHAVCFVGEREGKRRFTPDA
jgi:hypothetical protein